MASFGGPTREYQVRVDSNKLIALMLARIGGLLALLVTHTNFSVSSGVGFLALFGVSVQTGVN